MRRPRRVLSRARGWSSGPSASSQPRPIPIRSSCVFSTSRSFHAGMSDACPGHGAERVPSNRRLFPHADSYYVKEALNTPVHRGASPTAAAYPGRLETCHPSTKVTIRIRCLWPFRGCLAPFHLSPERRRQPLFSLCETDPDPVLQFVAHRNLGEVLLQRRTRTPPGLTHLDAAIDLLEKAYAALRRPIQLSP